MSWVTTKTVAAFVLERRKKRGTRGRGLTLRVEARAKAAEFRRSCANGGRQTRERVRRNKAVRVAKIEEMRPVTMEDASGR